MPVSHTVSRSLNLFYIIFCWFVGKPFNGSRFTHTFWTCATVIRGSLKGADVPHNVCNGNWYIISNQFPFLLAKCMVVLESIVQTIITDSLVFALFIFCLLLLLLLCFGFESQWWAAMQLTFGLLSPGRKCINHRVWWVFAHIYAYILYITRIPVYRPSDMGKLRFSGTDLG